MSRDRASGRLSRYFILSRERVSVSSHKPSGSKLLDEKMRTQHLVVGIVDCQSWQFSSVATGGWPVRSVCNRRSSSEGIDAERPSNDSCDFRLCESSWRKQRPTLESDFSSTESRTKRDADTSWLITATAWQLKSITSCGGVSWRKLAQRENELESVCCHEANV